MRINSCEIKAFGRFQDTPFDDLAHPILIIEGYNEAGKTTFFNFLRNMLYGFHPDKAEEHPYALPDMPALSGALSVVTAREGVWTINRTLHEGIDGAMVNGTAESIGNEPLPHLKHIPREVFQSVFSLGLYDLMEFSTQAWDDIYERLLGGLSMGFIKPASVVREDLESEAEGLWQLDSNTKTASGKVELQLLALRKDLRIARQTQERIRTLSGEVEAFKQEQKALHEEQLRIRANKRRAERLMPVYKRLRKIELLEREAGDAADLAEVPEYPLDYIRRLREEIKVDGEKSDASFFQVKSLQGQVKKEAENLFDQPLSRVHVKLLRTVRRHELRHRVEEYQETLAQLIEVKMYARMIAIKHYATRSLIPGFFVILLSIGLFFGDLYYLKTDYLLAVAIGIFAFGVMHAFDNTRHNRALGKEKEEDWPGVEEYELEAGVKLKAIKDLLAGLPLPKIRVEEPDEALVDQIEVFLDLMDAYSEQNYQAKQLFDEQKAKNATKVQEIKKLEKLIYDLGDGDMRKGERVLAAQRDALLQAQQSKRLLETDYPDLEELKKEIKETEDRFAATTWSFSDEDIIGFDQRLDELSDQLEEIATRVAERKKDIEQLLEQRRPDDIAGEIQYLENERLNILRRHDRLVMLSTMLHKADKDFRARHQPAVLRLASEYLNEITASRYVRIVLNEESDGLFVEEGEEGKLLPLAPPLSQGTCDQIFLSIRLAIVDHLDHGQDRVPVFLDEVLVNWDVGRREHVYPILRSMAEHRQIFLFTCHEWLADEAEEKLHAHRVVLHNLV